MLQIIIPANEYFVDSTQEFIYVKEQKLNLEHSLISISKWESKWKKPFLGKDDKTYAESVDYVRCMTLNKDVDQRAYYGIPKTEFDKINKYISDSMTATWFNDNNMPKRRNGTVVTSELIYYWMVAFNIPFDPCEKWHLNRLLTLIRIADIKNQPPKKMKAKDVVARNRALNEARKKKLGTNG